MAACSSVLYVPLAVGVLVLGTTRFGVAGLGFAVGSAVLHVAYFLLLQAGYRLGDLSVVYPLARGTGPLLALGGAVLLLGERPSAVAIGGAVLVAGGVLVLARSGTTTDPSGRGGAVPVGLATGGLIASYTLWDARAVTDSGVSPLLLSAATGVGEAILLAPIAARRRQEVHDTWRRHRAEVLGVALLSPLAYVLVLVALTLAPVSAVAPAREMSIVVGALLGGRLLEESDRTRRLLASASVATGVLALTVG